MRSLVIAFAALAALAACSDNSTGPALPETPEGAQAPVELEAQGPVRQADISDEQRVEFEQLIRRYLDAAQQRFANGLSETPEAPEQIVTLLPGGDYRWHIDLAAGASYRFIGACDDDCTNIDFELIAPGGGVVASDLLDDDFPVASYTVEQAGQYIGRLMMIECSVAPCFAGARVLSGAPPETGSKPPTQP